MVDQPTGSGSAFLQRPSTDEIRFAIRQFRMVVESGSGEDFTALIIVTTTLLALAARMKGEQPDDDDVDVPRRSSPEDHAVIQARFSSLYDRGDDDQEAAEGWTHIPWDDLGDLYHDMRTVDDVFEFGREADARWEFRFGFESHWGEHALSLIGYLLRSYRF